MSNGWLGWKMKKHNIVSLTLLLPTHRVQLNYAVSFKQSEIILKVGRVSK